MHFFIEGNNKLVFFFLLETSETLRCEVSALFCHTGCHKFRLTSVTSWEIFFPIRFLNTKSNKSGSSDVVYVYVNILIAFR